MNANSSEKIRVSRLDELVDGRRCVRAYGRVIALFKVGERVLAIDDVCPHKGGPLSEGDVERGAIVCPLHGWAFDLETGAMVNNEELVVWTYEVELRGDEIFVGPPRMLPART